MIRANGSPEQNGGRGAGMHRRGFREGWGPGACGVRCREVPEDEARRELQVDTRAGITGRGRNGWRNRGLELEAREEL